MRIYMYASEGWLLTVYYVYNHSDVSFTGSVLQFGYIYLDCYMYQVYGYMCDTAYYEYDSVVREMIALL